MKYSFAAKGLFGVLLLLIVGSSSELEGQASAEPDSLQQYVEEARKLFSGKIRLSNGGPSCISCHQVVDDQLSIGGGSYALNLTPIYGQFGEKATRNFIKDSPFAVMNKAYENHPVTDKEVDKLTAYLRYVSEQQSTGKDSADQSSAGQQPYSTGLNLLWSGLVGFGVILLGIWGLWRHRKRGSVNESIYQRQTKSV